MTFELTATQALKSFLGAAVCGLGLDFASLTSSRLSDVAWFALREVAGFVFWGALAGWQATHVQVFGHELFFLSCPLQALHSLGSLAHLVSTTF